jgi:ribosome-binding factor A
MGRRPERLAEEMREEIARMIATEVKDPRLGFVTVTRVEVAHDLRYARVHVGVLGSEADREKSLTALRSAAGFIRRELGRRLRIHHAPEVDFRYDKGLDATDRVARLLAEEAERATAADRPADLPADVGSEGGGEAGSDRDRDERTGPTAPDRGSGGKGE